MKTIRLKLKDRSYDIITGSNIINRLAGHIAGLNIGKDAYIVTNSTVKRNYGELLRNALQKYKFNIRFKLVKDTEASKSIETASLIIKDIANFDKQKRIFIIAFGGGVIGDLSGFIASIYKRGIPYVGVPTTLLAQVDSSIGGKTAVDLREGKNLLGAFYQPKLVYSDTSLLRTLSKRQIKTGLAEVIKYGIIRDLRLFKYLEENIESVLRLKQPALELIVERCSNIKAGIVGMDEKEEKGIRTILNFGHTIGHAIEAAGGYSSYNHGEAIALGMIVASRISQKMNLINKGTLYRIENLIRRAGLPCRIKGVSFNAIIKAHYRDKKFIGRKNRFVLIKSIGKTTIVENVPIGLVEETLKGIF
ncbi:MAG: 3-dehydroquinate synthase [Candidatus Omnitrophota bacterium]